MSYEILYQRFLLKKEDGTLVPYMIHGSNNCYEWNNRRRARSLSNLFRWFKRTDQSDLDTFLGEVFDLFSGDDCIERLPKTKKGFIRGFHQKIVPEDDFSENPTTMEDRLERKYTKKRNIKDGFQLHNEMKNVPLSVFRMDRVEDMVGKTILAYNHQENLIGKGKVKPVREDKYGFFPTRFRRRYVILNSVAYYKEAE